jgi:plastocyanin
MKKFLLLLATFSLIATFLVACTDPTTGQTPTPGSSGSSGNTVHMNETQFVPTTITIKKGESINLVNDAAVVHIIQNGTWESNGTPKAEKETGAPTVQQQFNSNDSHSIGPFTTAGTFQLYCTVHEGMNLTVIVK